MLRVLGTRRSACDGVSRRELLSAGGAGLLGVNLPSLLAAEDASATIAPRAKSVIFMFLFGGPSQLETFDMKPEAPAKIRGPFRPTASRTPGLLIGEHLPETAKVSDRFCVIRTMTHPYNDHSGAGHYIQTGCKWQIPIGGGFNTTPKDWPSMGSVVEYTARHAPQRLAARKTHDGLPNYVVLPNSLGRLQEYKVRLRRPGEYAGWLGRAYEPVRTAIDKRDAKDNPYFRDCTDEELTYQIEGLVSQKSLTLDRLQRRRSLLEQFDDSRALLETGSRVAAFDDFQRRALALVSSEKTRQALDIRKERAALRDRYGRNLFGQSTLMARRLVEAGARFVTVHYDAVDGYSWDSHRSSHHLKNYLIPSLDKALSSLLRDLEDRGLLDETLVVCLGEMGRTPKANGKWGRGHWSTLFPAVLAGAGIRGGTLHGSSDRDAAYPVDNPVKPEDLAATIYEALGVGAEFRVRDRLGRPVPVTHGGNAIGSLFG